ncbi:hypothetical protein ACOMHN_006457 [Nucella lapillus]
MSNLGGLPNMGKERLTFLQRQVQCTTKATAILNDKLKDSLDRVERSVDRQKQSEEFRCWQQAAPMKTSLKEKQALSKCLRHRRLSFSNAERQSSRLTQNGAYDGAPLQSMKAEVNQILSEMTPAYRRMKKLEQFKSLGYRDGQLVRYEDSLHKFQDVLNRLSGRRPAKHHQDITALSQAYGLSPRRPPLLRRELRREQPLNLHSRPRARSLSSSSSDEEDWPGYGDSTVRMRSASADGVRRLELPRLPAAVRSQYGRSLPPTFRGNPSKFPPIVRGVSR